MDYIFLAFRHSHKIKFDSDWTQYNCNLEIPNELLTWTLNKDMMCVYMHQSVWSEYTFCDMVALDQVVPSVNCLICQKYMGVFYFFSSLIETFLFINLLYAFVLPVNAFLNIKPHCILGRMLAFLFWCIPTSCSWNNLLFRAFQQSLHFFRSTKSATDQFWTHAERFTSLFLIN